ncbi:MAG: hypothetical protein II864_09585 [Prevotella sp.]|nr:hypothetical protein [Prevotella sp.]
MTANHSSCTRCPNGVSSTRASAASGAPAASPTNRPNSGRRPSTVMVIIYRRRSR